MTPSEKLIAEFKRSNIFTSPTIGPDRHTAFIELGENIRPGDKFGEYEAGAKCVLQATSYESPDRAAELLLEMLRHLHNELQWGFRSDT